MMSLVALLVLSAQEAGGVVKTEFIYETAPFPSCHASTIVETPTGLVAAWFGGRDEGAPDVGIWVSRHDGKAWSAPVEVADGVQSPAKRYPCWNPVLFQAKDGPLLLFYKVGPSPSTWWGLLRTSEDGGKTWSKARMLPEGFLGPIKNKPVLLKNGMLLCPTSSEHEGWRVHFERTPDLGKSWEKTGPVNDGKTFGAIQPSVLFLKDGSLLALCRSRQQRIVEVASADGGKTWSGMQATALPNNNAGFDGVTLADGRHLLVYNHATRDRSPLNVALSEDGRAWQAALVLENQPGEYSYPAAIQAADDKIHITYTWKRRRVRHVVVDPARLALRPIVDGQWPK